MKNKKNQAEDLLAIEENDECAEVFDDSPYYHDPAYPEFDGWRDLL